MREEIARRRRPRTCGVVMLGIALSFGFSCQRETEVHVVRGQVVRLADGGRQLVVDHEAISGLMGAMRMMAPLQDPTQAEGLKRGEKIRFELTISGGHSSVGRIERLPPETELSLAAEGG